MPPGSMALTLPLGPSTRTVLPFSLTVYLTPAGRAIGFLPIRDMMNPFMACESREQLVLVVPLQPVSQRLECSPYRIENSNLKTLCLFFFFQTLQRISHPNPSRRALRT